MKYVKNIIILLICIMLASSAKAGLFDEESVEERLGRAVCVVLDKTSRSSLEENRNEYTAAETLISRLFSSTTDASSHQELSAMLAKIGKRYVADASPVLNALKDLTETKDPDNEAAMYHRAHLLLDGIGVTEEEDQAKAKAFALIQTTLEANSDNQIMQALLFRYFLPSGNPLALAHFGRLVIKIGRNDETAHKHWMASRWTNRDGHPDIQLLKEANKALGLNFDLIRVERRDRLEAIEKETQGASASSSEVSSAAVR